MKKNLLSIGLFMLLSCSRYQPCVHDSAATATPPENPPEYTIYFSGDFTNPDPALPNMQLINRILEQENRNSAFVLLGNLVYPKGLPDREEKQFDQASDRLRNILNPFRGYRGKLLIVPGNRDWENGGSHGSQRVKNLEAFAEQYLDRGNIFLPDNACPGPVEVDLDDQITLILFNSQWWLQKSNKYSDEYDCDFDDIETEEDYRREILLQVQDALERNKHRHVIFAAHHPLFSAGRHGGHFPARENLFPLLAVNRWLWIPLPGFLYTASRAGLGEIQDAAHPEYRQMRTSLMQIIKNYPNTIFLAAHDHNLQYSETGGIHHMISGAATEADYVARRGINDFAMQTTGIGKLSFNSDGEVWLEFLVPDQEHKQGKVVFSKKLYRKETGKSEPFSAETIPDYTDSTVTIAASEQYNVGKFTQWLMGENYREVWNQPVEFPVFDIGKVKGGLKIVKRGGGQQTKSVRLEADDGRQYVLRSVEKYVEGALPHELWGTMAVDVVQDGISQSHPYAAMAVAQLARRAGVYHTNPKIVFVPDDPRLGIYRKEMAGKLYLFEERPDDDRRDVESFGRPSDITSTSKVLKKTQNQHDEFVDQQAVLRARLFDMLIADWDRHADQWRWAEFEEGEYKIYRPIPRDRDNAFFIAEGPVQWLVKRKWLQPKFQGFDEDTKNIPGFNYNARYFDRSFLNETTRYDWQKAAVNLQQTLTDEKIESAIKEGLPEEIFAISGQEIITKLKARRNRLDEFADEYYLFLSKAVDIPGTDDRDLFIVERLDDERTRVTGRELSRKKGKLKGTFYARTFYHNETEEIRIYGLKDEDRFEITGDVDEGIKVRIIGGKGTDTIIDHSKVAGLSRKTLVYDRPKSTFLHSGSETKNLISKAKGINDYDREQFKYNKVIPQAYFGYSLDDGIFLGGGALIKTYNFRDSTRHRILGNFAYQTLAFNIRYSAVFSSLLRRFDLVLDGMVSAPTVVNNFFGFGNETPKITDDKDYYRVRYHYAYFSPMARKSWDDELQFFLGPFFVFGKVEDTKNRFITNLEQNGLNESIFLDQYFAGVNAQVIYDTRDDKVFPNRGILWNNELRNYQGLNSHTPDFTSLKSDLRLYLSFRKDPRLIFAVRFGGGKNLGDYPFYFSQSLGGKTNLRGFRANRFSGDAAAYQNTDIRLKLFNLNTYVLTGQFGILGFNDVGRVWYPNEGSAKWHHGYGAGLWLMPYNKITLMLNYNMSDEEHYFDFHFSYLF
ncbi:MAG: BamA/TamA family outer membrane protein [Bacteroidales bacterium]